MTLAHVKAAHPLTTRHFRQVIRRPKQVAKSLLHVWSLSFRPGNMRNNFAERFRPLGSPVAIVLASEEAPGNDPAQLPYAMPLTGTRAQIDPNDGSVYWGGRGGDLFGYDFSRRPFPGARGKIPDPETNPSLVRRALEMDRLRERVAKRSFLLPVSPTLPTVYVGFTEKSVPPCWDSPALRDAAARDQGCTVHELEKASEPQRQAWLEATWQRLLWAPQELREGCGNTTGHWLLEHIYCPPAAILRSLRVYEFFGPSLVGAAVWNPARDCESQLRRVANPAASVCASVGLAVERQAEWSQDQARVEEVLAAMRQVVGTDFSEDDCVEAIQRPELPLVNGAQAVAVLRKHLATHDASHVAECCVDADLVKAARDLSSPLLASQMPVVQQLYREPGVELDDALTFNPQALRRPKVYADFISAASRWRRR